MARQSYIYGYSWLDKLISAYTFSSAAGNYDYSSKRGGVHEYFHALGEDFLKFPSETVEEYTEADGRIPYFWNHIEQGNTRIQGIGMVREDSDEGDNIKRIQRNGIEYKSKILTGVGIADEDNLLGIVYLPMTDRLNT